MSGCVGVTRVCAVRGRWLASVLVAFKLVACTIAVVTLAACNDRGVRDTTSAFKPLAVGGTVPPYTAAMIGGGDSLRIGAGAMKRLTLLNVWATWCVPCRKEFPELEQLHRTFSGAGLYVVGVSIDEGVSDDRVRQTAGDLGGTFAIARDAGGNIQNLFRAIGVPETYLIGSDGTLLWRHVGAITPDLSELEQLIRKSLGGGH